MKKFGNKEIRNMISKNNPIRGVEMSLRDTHTWRGLDNRSSGSEPYYKILGFGDEGEFLAWIKDKEVLDLGSGYGGLTHDLYAMNFQNKGHVMSVNPEFLNPYYIKRLQPMVRASLSKLDKDGKEKADDELDNETDLYIKNYFERAVATKWAGQHTNKNKEKESHFLPFRDGAFDIVLCSYSLSLYGEISEVPMALEDIVRILKPGGELRIVPVRSKDRHEMDGRFDIILKMLKRMDGVETSVLPVAGEIYECIIVKKRNDKNAKTSALLPK